MRVGFLSMYRLPYYMHDKISSEIWVNIGRSLKWSVLFELRSELHLMKSLTRKDVSKGMGL
jgi:hypothetical protein